MYTTYSAHIAADAVVEGFIVTGGTPYVRVTTDGAAVTLFFEDVVTARAIVDAVKDAVHVLEGGTDAVLADLDSSHPSEPAREPGDDR